MSPSAFIVARTTKKGKRYHVRYRLGGRYSQAKHAGSFPSKAAAEERRRFCISEIAAGRDPLATLNLLATVERAHSRTLGQWGAAFATSRRDVDTETARGYQTHLNRLGPIADLDPATMTHVDVQAWIEHLLDPQDDTLRPLAPSSVHTYVATLKQVIDYAGVDPNPARDKRVKLPRVEKDEVVPPSADHYLQIVERIARKNKLPVVVMEQTAMRVGSVVSLQWGDVDEAGCRFRLKARNTKTDRAMWIQVPDWLMKVVAETCAPEDRSSDRRVFPGVTETSIRSAMTAACQAAGIPHYTPHGLRHRRASLWHGQGVSLAELKQRGGWSRAEIALDTYSHVMPLDEAPVARVREALRG